MSLLARYAIHAVHHKAEEGIETCLLLIRFFYLICLFLGAALGAVMLGWSLGSWTGLLPQAQVVSQAPSFFRTPWEGKVWTLIAFYGVFVWIFYLLPAQKSNTRPVHYGHMVGGPVKRPSKSGMWKHLLLWSVVFGPLAHACGWYDGLSWPLWSIVIAGLLWGFYIEVWQDSTRQWKAEMELYRMVEKTRRHHSHA